MERRKGTLEGMEIESSYQNIKKVIITGATGFIGYALAEKLCRMQVEVWAVVRKNSNTIPKLQGLGNIKLVYCELNQYDELENLITDRGFDTFYHFAWQGVADQDAQNQDIQLANVKYACDAVQAAQKLRCRQFVFAASIMEYEVMKLMETDLKADKRNVYRTAKLTAHYMTKILADDLSLHYNAAVISNVFGRGEISNRFICSTLRKMLNGERVKFTEAKQIYDFVYIDDAVEMLILIAEKGINNKNYYIGSMEPRVLREFIYEIRECVDASLEIGIGKNKEYVGVSLDYDETDIKACYDDFGYVPKHSFKEGIKKTIEWMRKTETNK